MDAENAKGREPKVSVKARACPGSGCQRDVDAGSFFVPIARDKSSTTSSAAESPPADRGTVGFSYLLMRACGETNGDGVGGMFSRLILATTAPVCYSPLV